VIHGITIPTEPIGSIPRPSELIQAIALTAFARSEDRTRALHAGFLVHVSESVEPSELVATVASVVGRTGSRAAP
jgi:CheY-like chemotaxis protein